MQGIYILLHISHAAFMRQRCAHMCLHWEVYVKQNTLSHFYPVAFLPANFGIAKKNNIFISPSQNFTIKKN